MRTTYIHGVWYPKEETSSMMNWAAGTQQKNEAGKRRKRKVTSNGTILWLKMYSS